MSRPTHDIVKVAVGIVFNSVGQILVALRPAHTPHGGLWEFPGGKFEPSETALEALKRELFEEVGVTVLEASPLICVHHDYGSHAISVALDAWIITRYTGEPYGKEGQETRWIEPQELTQLQFPEGNGRIIQALLSAIEIYSAPEV